MEQLRDFKGVWIPKEVWLDKRLNALDKIILAEIDSLDNEETGCYASNEYMAEFCQCGITKVSTAISKLIELGYVYVQSFNGRTRIVKSRLSNFERQDFKKCKADLQKNKGINIINNNIKDKNNIDKESKEKSDLFQKFWEAYPKKIDKQGSYKAFKNIPNIEKLLDKILKDISHKKQFQWGNVKYIPHPTTYLHQHRWEDEVEGQIDDVEEWYKHYWDDKTKTQKVETDQEIEEWYMKEYGKKVKVVNGRIVDE